MDISPVTLTSHHFTDGGLMPPDTQTTFADWWKLADQISYYENVTKLAFTWLWGGWLNGLERWPDKHQELTGQIGKGDGYKLLETKTGKSLKTLQHWAWLERVYTVNGQPDPIRLTYGLFEGHFTAVAAIKDRAIRNRLLITASEEGWSKKRLEEERQKLYPQLSPSDPPPAYPDDLAFQQTVENHLLRAAVTDQHLTIARLNGNVLEAEARLKAMADRLTEGGTITVEELQGTRELLRPQELSADVALIIRQVIEAFRDGEITRVLAGVEQLAGLKELF